MLRLIPAYRECGMKKWMCTIWVVTTLAFPNLQAIKGNVKTWEDGGDSSKLWGVERPKVILALGYLQEKLQKKMKRLKGLIEAELKQHTPEIEVEVINYATGSDIVKRISRPEVVGLIFVSHTYKAKSLDSTVFLGGDGYPLPSEILSAATPALRFASFLGCYGEGIMRHYQVSYELNRLPGKQRFYFSSDKKLSAGFLGINGVRKAVNEIAKSLKEYDFSKGLPPSGDDVTLSLRVSDVVPGLEPRYLFVNGYIVGVIGDAQNDHDLNDESGVATIEELEFDLPKRYLREEGCQQIAIRSSDLSPNTPADDYKVYSLRLSAPNWDREVLFDGGKHLGDDNVPTQGEKPIKRELTPFERAVIKKKFPGWKEGTTPLEKGILMEFLVELYQYMEWEDRDPSNWPVLEGRFLSYCL
jgi:hypothetical protein